MLRHWYVNVRFDSHEDCNLDNVSGGVHVWLSQNMERERPCGLGEGPGSGARMPARDHQARRMVHRDSRRECVARNLPGNPGEYKVVRDQYRPGLEAFSRATCSIFAGHENRQIQKNATMNP